MKNADKEGHILETIIEEFALHPFSMPALWDCREYFYRLDTQDCIKNPVLVTHLALISSMAGRLDQAKDYLKLIGETPQHWQPQDLNHTDFYRIALEMVMPYTSDTMFLRIVFYLIKAHAVPVRGLTLSACRPSIINGFRDFTRYGPYLVRHGDIITDTVQQLYGSGGQSVYEILLAEWYYQNNDCFNALVLVTGTIPLIEQNKDMRCLFVALALQMKILLVNGQTRMAKPLVEKIRERIHETGWEELTSSLNALACLAACYDGRQEEVTQWLEHTAPDENKDIYMMDMYAYLVKIRCYLQMGKYMVAHVLVKQLITLLIPGKRHMDLCECYMLSAIIYYKAGEKGRMCEELDKSLELARRYHYIRLLADEGSCMVQMLSIYQQERGADGFTDTIMDLAGEVGRHFPNYLKSPAEYYEPLTTMEKNVFRLMAQGMSNDEIADRLGKKTGTVKFHSNNIFRKLQVQNRQQAVNRGREIGLL
ncbi:MAG: LuxR C-terminal-related transcriptional regulator [Lachnospiraceae bacterium]